MRSIDQIMKLAPVVPVVNIEQPDDAVKFAQSIHEAGLNIIEVTLRTPLAMEAITAIKQAVPDMCVGAGTVWDAKQAESVVTAGVEFVVTPGRTDAVVEVCEAASMPILPGAQTVSEVAYWASRGLTAVKFFPAQLAGGAAALKAFSSVFPDLQFCPTGGINLSSAPDYLKLSAVPCVGGSWLVDKTAIAENNWSKIQTLASEAMAL